MLHILHAADFHLDAPFASLPPEQAAIRRGEQRDLLARFAEAARSRGADLVLLSGDLLDGPNLYAETASALVRALGDTGCPVFLSPGNHDFWSGRSPCATLNWPDNVHIFTSESPEAISLPALNCTVYGAAFTSPTRETSPLAGFSCPRNGQIQLGVFHGDVDGVGRYAPITREEIAASGLTYLALGHIHTASGLQKAGNTFWSYSGCPEGRGFDESGDKGAVWVTVDGDQVQSEFIPLAGRRYEILTVDLSGADTPLDALRAALPPDGSRDIYRILLTGESDAAGPDLAPLRELAERSFFRAEVRDRTRLRRDLWARAKEDTLTGLFLRQLQAKMKNADEETAALCQLAARFGLAALEHSEEPSL
jgi:DNA repair exonuclease SbcCD nuclease subunit